MLEFRIIPVLLIDENRLVKTTKFSNPRYLGDPINAVRIFNDKKVDELVLLDISASRNNCPPNFKLIEEIASECFMPLAYGGGVSQMEHVKRLFSIGIEKVILNTAVIESFDLVRQCAEIFGNQSVVVSIDVKKNFFGRPFVYSHKSRKTLKIDALEFSKLAEIAGAGEIILNSVDQDGLMNGYDITLLKQITETLEIPLVVCGGAGNLGDFKEAKKYGAAAAAAGSLFVYYGPHKAILINYPNATSSEREIEKL